MKVPPQATDLEINVLGAILLEAHAFSKVVNILDKSHFYEPKHQTIYSNIQELDFENKPIDILTLAQKLEQKGLISQVGGVPYIAELTNKVSGSANIEAWSRIIQQYAIQRNLIAICNDTIEKCYNKEDIFDVSEAVITQLDNAFNFIDANFPRLAGEVLTELIKSRRENKGKGLMTKFNNLDTLTNGLKPSELLILAARPAMGKTAFVLQLATQIAEQTKNVLVFSLEMSSEQLTRRIESQLSGLNNRNIETNKIYQGQDEMLDKAHKRIRNMGIHIDDTAAISVQKMKIKAKRVKQKFGLDCIIVDYLQLASGSQKGNREQEISEISRGLKVIAKELGVPVIALSQLSRAVESRSDKRPLLSDLRESGSIEQDADIVAFLYREKYYKKDLEQDITELIIAKHRNGGLDTLNFLFNGSTTSFAETELSLQQETITPFAKGNWTSVRDLSNEYDTPF